MHQSFAKNLFSAKNAVKKTIVLELGQNYVYSKNLDFLSEILNVTH